MVNARMSPIDGPPKQRNISAEEPPSSDTGRTNAGDGPNADAIELAPVPPDMMRYERDPGSVDVWLLNGARSPNRSGWGEMGTGDVRKAESSERDVSLAAFSSSEEMALVMSWRMVAAGLDIRHRSSFLHARYGRFVQDGQRSDCMQRR